MLRQIKSVKVSKCQSVKDLFFSILSASLLTVPFFYPNLWIFAWVGFVPLFLAIAEKSKGKAFLLSYFTGVVFWLGTIYWLTSITVVGYIFLSLYLALYFGLFGLIIRSYKLEVINYKLFLIPAAWVVLECIRGHLLTGFPWALLGYSQYKNLPIIQIADIAGAYGVSALVVMGNVLIYEIISCSLQAAACRQKINKFLLLACGLLLAACGYGYYKLHLSPIAHRPSPIIRISLIQANIPQDLKWNALAKADISEKYFRLTSQAVVNDRPDLIIWPETAMQDYLVIEKRNYSNIGRLADFVKGINTPLLLGMVGLDSENFYNSAVFFSQKGEILARYDKLHLVPFGEYIPLRKVLPFLETVVPIGDFTPGREYTLFQSPIARRPSPGIFSTLICFEDVFPDLARNFVKRGAQFLVNITNDAWFGDTSEPFQHLAASVFRAIENRVSVVRAANTGVSCFIFASGKINSVVNSNGKETFVGGYITDSVSAPSGRSLYNKYGDVFALLCFLIVGCGIINKLRMKSEK